MEESRVKKQRVRTEGHRPQGQVLILSNLLAALRPDCGSWALSNAGVEAKRRKLCWVARQKTSGAAAVATCNACRALGWKGWVLKTAAIHTWVSKSEPGTSQVLLKLAQLFQLEQFLQAGIRSRRTSAAPNHRQPASTDFHHRARSRCLGLFDSRNTQTLPKHVGHQILERAPLNHSAQLDGAYQFVWQVEGGFHTSQFAGLKAKCHVGYANRSASQGEHVQMSRPLRSTWVAAQRAHPNLVQRGACASTLIDANHAARLAMSSSLKGLAISDITSWLRLPLR